MFELTSITFATKVVVKILAIVFYGVWAVTNDEDLPETMLHMGLWLAILACW